MLQTNHGISAQQKDLDADVYRPNQHPSQIQNKTPCLTNALPKKAQSCLNTECYNEALIVHLKRMAYSQINTKNWKLAVLFSAIFSLFGVYTKSTHQSDLNLLQILSDWLLSFSFLLLAWYLNSVITNLLFSPDKKWNLISKILLIILSNSLLLISFILLSILISKVFHLERDYNYFFLIVRGCVSIAILYIVQYTLNQNERNQSILLQNQILKTENIRAQFEVLKQQISPHFLFNSLSSLRSMIRSSDKNAENFVLKLSDIYRLLLANKQRDAITLKEEIAFIENYSFLLFERHENMVHLEIDIPPDLLEYRIPTFALQLLLENCVKHNIVSKEKPLYIKIYDSGVQSISVENNLQKKILEGEESGNGLQNLIKRYDLLGVSNGVQVFSDESIHRVKIKLLN